MIKHYVTTLFFFALLILFCSFNISSSYSKDKLIIGWNEWPPHQSKTGGNLAGINIDLLNELCKRAGFKAEFVEMPWKRNLKGLQTGEVDVAMSASKTAEREKFAYFSGKYFKLEFNVMFAKKSNIKKYSNIKKLKDIIGTDYIVGTGLGSIYSDEHSELIKNKDFMKNVQEVKRSELNLAKLQKERVTGFIEDELTGVQMIKKAALESEVAIHFYLYEEKDAEAYLMYSKKSMTPDHVAKMNKALKDMRDDGSYKKLLQKYGLAK